MVPSPSSSGVGWLAAWPAETELVLVCVVNRACLGLSAGTGFAKRAWPAEHLSQRRERSNRSEDKPGVSTQKATATCSIGQAALLSRQEDNSPHAVSRGSAISDAEKRQHPSPYPHIEIGGRGARLLEGHSEVAAEKTKSNRHHM